jgi:hypothetical protein
MKILVVNIKNLASGAPPAGQQKRLMPRRCIAIPVSRYPGIPVSRYRYCITVTVGGSGAEKVAGAVAPVC